MCRINHSYGFGSNDEDTLILIKINYGRIKITLSHTEERLSTPILIACDDVIPHVVLSQSGFVRLDTSQHKFSAEHQSICTTERTYRGLLLYGTPTDCSTGKSCNSLYR